MDFKFSHELITIVLMLILYIIASFIIESKKYKYTHESAVAITLGIVLGLILKLSFGFQIEFDEKIFFNFILPPIIFSAGYNLPTKHFFQNLGQILYIGLGGTLIQFTIISTFGLILNEIDFIIHSKHKLEISEILLLACVLTSTDTVASLSLVNQQQFPKLNSIIFGEGIVNDAASILLFKSISFYTAQKTSLLMLGQFTYILTISVFIGLFFGFLLTFFLKQNIQLREFPIKETGLVMLNGYLSYLFAEIFEFSGIISLFCCGVIMSEYAHQNLSDQSQKGVPLVFESIAYLAEGFVFIYLGLTTLSINYDGFQFWFIIFMILVLAFARFFAVFLLPCLQYIFVRKHLTLKIKELKVLWYSGLIRGAVSFALCFQIESPNKNTIVITTVMIVLCTIFVLSMFLQTFAEKAGFDMDNNSDQVFLEYNQSIMNDKQNSKYGQMSSYDKIQFEKQMNPEKKYSQLEYQKKKEQENMNYMQKKFQTFNEKVINPIFVSKKDDESINVGLVSMNQKQ